MAESGYAWGIYPGNEVNTIPYGWDGDMKPSGTDIDGWEIKEAGTQANWTSSLGDLSMSSGDEYVSPVINRGSTAVKHFSIDLNDVSSPGVGIALQYRGSADTFNQDATNATLPWEDYPVGGENKSWQYVQIKAKCITFLEM